MCRRLLVVHVAQRDDILRRRAAVDVARRLAARADGGDIQFLVRRFVPQRLQRRSAAEPAGRNRAGQQRAIKKMSSSEWIECHTWASLGRIVSNIRVVWSNDEL